ncbi:hypothetical protein T492DRAFT_897494 [Pavlovales sp. CCMP2436]|nr:hypothetical protein T492DRAFT_897494 [Pavlovales sp. CCMP2436]
MRAAAGLFALLGTATCASKQGQTSDACARTLVASSATTAAHVRRALGKDGVIVHTSECGTFDFATFGREACLRLTLSSKYQGTSRGSFLHANLPMCLFYTAQGEGNKGSPTADIGWLFTDPGSLWQGPAWPQDSWAGTTSGTVAERA